jgi:hypothetical protein
MARKPSLFVLAGIAALVMGVGSTHDAASAKVAATSPLLKVIVGAGAAGNLKAGTKPYSPGARVHFSFTPKPGHSAAKVVLDGKLVRPKGTITMDGDHWLWAFGNPEKGKPLKNVMTVPSDVTKIPYPAFYQKRPSFDFKVADPYCALSQNVVAYPTSYLGEFPMPPVVGAPLPSSVRLGMSPHDVWDANSASYNYKSGCRDKVRDAFLIMLDRCKRLNVHHLSIPQWSHLKDGQAADLEFMTGDYGLGVPDSDMPWLVAQAKKAGLQVYELMQVVSLDFNRVSLPNPPSADFASRFLDAYTRFLLNRARQAQKLRIDALRVDWNDYWVDWANLHKDLYLTKMREAARQVRAVYNGKLLCGSNAPEITAKDEILKSRFDWFEFGGYPGVYTEEENANLTISLLKDRRLANLAGLADWMGANKKPVVLGLFAQSHRNFLFTGWVEDTFDTGLQKALKIDFSVQALAYEAGLEAIAECVSKDILTVVGVDSYAYWYTDCILPKDSYPNHSASVRNKPAESILFQWFRRE